MPQKDKARGYFLDSAPQKHSRVMREKYDRIVAIVKAEPGLTRSEIAQRFYPADATRQTKQKINNILVELTCANRLAYLGDDRYVVVEN